jgi:hypothetical protein
LSGTAVAIFLVSLVALGSPYIDLAVGDEWGVEDVNGQTKTSSQTPPLLAAVFVTTYLQHQT